MRIIVASSSFPVHPGEEINAGVFVWAVVEALVRAMETDPRLGSCASKMILSQNRDVIESAGIAVDRAGTV